MHFELFPLLKTHSGPCPVASMMTGATTGDKINLKLLSIMMMLVMSDRDERRVFL